MALTSTAKIERELIERVSLLSPAKKREALDFIEFLSLQNRKPTLQQQGSARKTSRVGFDAITGITPLACPLDAFIGIASDCKDTDLSVNHDKYLYGDDPI